MTTPFRAPDLQALEGKRVLVVVGGEEAWGERRNDCITRAIELGVEVVLLGAASSYLMSIVHAVLPANTANYESCRAAVQHYLATDELHGIVTFLEERIEIAARLQAEFGFKGHSIAGSRASRDKTEMRETLRKHQLPVPSFTHLNTRTEATAAAGWFPTPAFIKPAAGGGSVATRRITNSREIVPAFDAVCREIAHVVPPEIVDSLLSSVSANQANLLLEEYLEPARRLTDSGLGRVGIELLVQDGNIQFFAMADGQCFSRSDHRYASLRFPSRLDKHDEQQFRALADEIIAVFKLSNGPVILDAVMTDRGPQLYEINARIDGSVVLPLIEVCYGVDMIRQSLKTAVGVPLLLEDSAQPTSAALVHFFLAAAPAKITSLEFPNALPFHSDCRLQQLKQEDEIVLGPEATYDAIATLSMIAPDRDELDERFQRYLAATQIKLEPLAAPPTGR